MEVMNVFRVSRRQFAKSQKIKDDIKKSLPYSTCLMNIYKHLTRKNPKSVIELGRKMFENNGFDKTDSNIEGMNNASSSSSSSSSYDEPPAFLMPNPLQVVYGKNPNVMLVGADGKIIQHISHEEFLKNNPQYANMNMSIPPAVQNPEEMKEITEAQIPVSPPSVAFNQEGKGEFSEKYKAKLEQEKHRKTDEDMLQDSNTDTQEGI